MAFCKAFDPIDESPPWRPDPHPSCRRTHARTRATPVRPALFAQTISARAHPNPAQRPRIAFLHERIRSLHARTRALNRSGQIARAPRTSEPDPAARPSDMPAFPPRPEQGRLRTIPTSFALGRPSGPTCALSRTCPPSLRLGSRPGAAPAPPFGSLAEDRYRPVNACLTPRAPACDSSLFIFLSRAEPAMPSPGALDPRRHGSAARRVRPPQRRNPTARLAPRHVRIWGSGPRI